MRYSIFHTALTCGILWSCANDGAPPTLFPVAPVTAEVNQTLTIDFQVSNPSGQGLDWSYSGPSLPGLDQTALLIGTASGAQFRWTPLVSHIGTHQFDFRVAAAAGVSTQSVLIDVRPGAGTAPIFVQPNNGGTYNVDVTPCVSFDLEVKDDDSQSVAIRAATPMPIGATLAPQGNQRARFKWCPTEAQVNQSLTWTLTFEADDGEHTPTLHDYLIVFRRTVQNGCTGLPPTIEVLEPAQDAIVTSSGGFDVVIRVTDDSEVRDAPVLYYTYTSPNWNSSSVSDSSGDLSLFEATTFEAEGPNWRASIPPRAGVSDTFDVWFVVSATDNDDETGTACDKRAETPLRHFLAAVGAAPAVDCELCAGNDSCQSGICSSDGVCIAGCVDDCACEQAVTIDGGTAETCGGIAACTSSDDTLAPCAPDPWSNGTQGSALSVLGGALTGNICGASESDWYKFTSGLDKVLTWTLEDHDFADVDLELVDESGSSLVLASTLAEVETASVCVSAGSVTYARVHLYPQSTASGGSYTINATHTDGSCCENDLNEPNNTIESAIPAFDVFLGTLCPQDKDHYSFNITEASTVEIWAETTTPANIRFTVHGPLPITTKMGTAYGPEGEAKWLGVLNQPGTYVVAVASLDPVKVEYGGEIILNPQIPCFSTSGCPIDSVCYEEDGCLPSGCESQLECPELHSCVSGITDSNAPMTCLESCANNDSCRTELGETCKRLSFGWKRCELAGSKTTGQSCESHRDCAGELGCYGWPGGYCAVMGCESNTDCPAGTICGQYENGNRCLSLCGEPGQPLCRVSEGYQCYLKLGADGEFYNACAYDTLSIST